MNSVGIEFANLTFYTREKKKILNGINGNFRAGKLNGILGPSGAGKSTLLNILAGLIHHGVQGDILINGKPRDNKVFHKISSYIAQEDVIQSYLTVRECIHVAADLKLGRKVLKLQQEIIINSILRSMCLDQCIDTKTQHLSGGQRKRLVIALELVNNPPIVFLDEPTTGLDEVTLLSCMKLLKKLTNEGRTIICSIHQPSDNVFTLFDHVYFLSNGNCIYRGNTDDIIPFLDEVKFSCPKNYNPADYIIELVSENETTTPLLAHGMEVHFEQIREDEFKSEMNNLIYCDVNLAPFWFQVMILVQRRFKQIFRNKLHLSIEIGHNIFSGVCVGLLFYKMGNNASTLMSNVFIFYAVNNYLIFTHGMVMVLLYPFEIKLLQKEYMNRWYSLKAYFLALNLSHFPVSVVGSVIISTIIYYMTGQPTDEIQRMLWFTFTTILYGLASQGFGLVIGTIFSPAHGACIGSAIGLGLVLLSICGTGYGVHISNTMKIVKSLSFVHHTYIAQIVSIFRMRDPADCDEVFCFFSNPRDILKIMGASEDGLLPSILYLVAFLVLHRLIAYVILKGRVNPDTKLYKILK